MPKRPERNGKMVITCVSCGSDRFNAGEIEISEDGGFNVVMPCAQCGTPSRAIHDDDPEFAKLLIDFFGTEGPGKFAHRLGS
jgi:hypothetical protein